MTLLSWVLDRSRIARTIAGKSHRAEQADARQAAIMKKADLIEQELEMCEWALERGVGKLKEVSRKEVTKLWG